jgi:CheY-like chemotaxis protein
VATSLGASALSLVREYPICAVTLDICLPDINGWRVLQRLKQDLETRHVPVFVVSTEEEGTHARSLGAVDMLVKPMQTKESVDELFTRIEQFVDQESKNILVVESDEQQREQFQLLVGNGKLRSTFVDTAKAALELMDDRNFDCVVYHMRPSDTSIDTLVDAIGTNDSLKHLPLVMTSDAFFALDATMTDRLARGTAIRHVQSPERLLDEVTQVLHLPVAELAEPQRKMLEKIHEDDAVLHGRQVLIVDDDIRNIFALTSVLERYNMRILAAETGRDAIQILQNTPEIDVVLMDIMMPEFDGLDTTRAIREIPQFKELPIIAVTAKAMKGDREKCIEAGAWDYLSKPVNPEQMLSVLRSWIRR